MIARPARWSNLIFSRYEPGHAYGTHVDDPMMTGDDGRRFRTDLSFTLFLSDPTTYSGGELVVEGRPTSSRAKLPAGGLLLYPSGDPHRVEPVTSGQRLACVGWVQSFVRRADQREVLFDLSRVKAAVDDPEVLLLTDKTLSNLMRMWAES